MCLFYLAQDTKSQQHVHYTRFYRTDVVCSTHCVLRVYPMTTGQGKTRTFKNLEKKIEANIITILFALNYNRNLKIINQINFKINNYLFYIQYSPHVTLFLYAIFNVESCTRFIFYYIICKCFVYFYFTEQSFAALSVVDISATVTYHTSGTATLSLIYLFDLIWIHPVRLLLFHFILENIKNVLLQEGIYRKSHF